MVCSRFRFYVYFQYPFKTKIVFAIVFSLGFYEYEKIFFTSVQKLQNLSQDLSNLVNSLKVKVKLLDFLCLSIEDYKVAIVSDHSL